MNEKVLVVPREELFVRGEFQGISTHKIQEVLKAIEKNAVFIDRDQAEKDSSQKQIIPYTVITLRSEILMVTRLATQGEARLHQKVSIGLGGHINPEDANGKKKPWEAGLHRELTEEVKVEGKWKPQLVALLNDDSTPVGSVHFGLVYRVDLTEGGVTIAEQDKMTGTFFPPDEVASFYNRMETWSQLVFSAFWPDYLSQEILLEAPRAV